MRAKPIVRVSVKTLVSVLFAIFFFMPQPAVGDECPPDAEVETKDGPVPSKMRVLVTESEVRIGFMWTEKPAVPAGRAVEFSLAIAQEDYYLLPIDGEDFNPRINYKTDLPCSYRDIYNHASGSSQIVKQGLIEYCNYPNNGYTAKEADILYEAIAATEDKPHQFAVGTMCPDKLEANHWYFFRYFVKRDPKGLNQTGGYAYIMHDSVHNTGCPLTVGDPLSILPWKLSWFGDKHPPIWLNRLCVPTEELEFTPRTGGNSCALKTACIDKDKDGWFVPQSYEMFGSNVGDCNDDPSKNGASVHPTHLEICNDGHDNNCDMQADCNDSTCSATPICLSPSTCPTGNGYYCGDASLGQDADAVYSCVDGTYSFAKSCNGLGCMKNGAMMDDVCNQGADPCAGVTCTSPPNPQCQNSSGTCVGGFCEYGFKPQGSVCNDGNACTSNDTCDAFGNCFGSGNCEVCDGVDNDGNGLIDDGISGCWTTIYRYKDPVTGARCLNNTNAGPPSACSSYGYEIEAFIIRATQMPNTFQGIQCSHLTDHIVVPFGSSDHNALLASSYDCSLSLGYFYYPGTGPAPGTTEWNKTCPMYRFSDPLQILDDGHIFTIYDNTAGITCEGYKADVLTNQTCFLSPPQGC